ncbi:hypothetical protein PHMEG_00021470, partial [Phytophthora megakarya]
KPEKARRTNGAGRKQASTKRKADKDAENSAPSSSDFEPESSNDDDSSSESPPPAKIRAKTKRVAVNKQDAVALDTSESDGGPERKEYPCRRMDETVFQNWQAFLSAFDDYCESTHQPFRNLTTAKLSRLRVVATLKRIKIAKNQFGFAVYVTKQHTTHTHPLNEDEWRAYGENRRVEDPKIIAMIRKSLHGTCKLYLAPLLRGKYADYTIKRADNIRQEDGHNCGVIVIHYVESYISSRVVGNPNPALL